jgi:3-hydroxyisobutyrate dehydrogenase
MLPSTPQVQSVYLDPKTGILPGLLSLPSNTPLLPRVPSPSSPDQAGTSPPSTQPHTLLVDGTTLDPTVAMEVAKRIHEETGGKALMIDAPVSGGKSGRGRVLDSPLPAKPAKPGAPSQCGQTLRSLGRVVGRVR